VEIELKGRFRAARALLGQAPPAGVAHARRAVAVNAVADELDIGVILVGRPVALEIIEEARPVRRQSMRLEIAQREGKAVVDADQRGRILGEPFHDIRRCRAGSSICEGSAAAGLRPAARRPRRDKRAGSSGSRSASVRPNSRYRCAE
jgi:hypothetical protein